MKDVWRVAVQSNCLDDFVRSLTGDCAGCEATGDETTVEVSLRNPRVGALV